MGEAVAQEVVVTRCQHLGLGGQAAQGGGVHHPRPVAGEVVAVGALLGRVLCDPPLTISTLIAHDQTLGAAPGAGGTRGGVELRLAPLRAAEGAYLRDGAAQASNEGARLG